MEKLHTRGKWYLQNFTDAYTNIIRCDDHQGHETLFIASTPQNPTIETRANAQLISASPDMLEALESCLQMLEQTKSFREHNGFTGGDTFLNYTIDQTKAAIEKAILIPSAVGEKI